METYRIESPIPISDLRENTKVDYPFLSSILNGLKSSDSGRLILNRASPHEAGQLPLPALADAAITRADVRSQPIADVFAIGKAMFMKRSAAWALGFFANVLSAQASAQLSGPKTASACIAVPGAGAELSATGRLTLRHMPGPPNFESIKHGDEDRPTLILVLPKPVCIDDGGDFADPKQRFRTVHVWTSDPTVERKLNSLVWTTVTISGDGYAADNALHYAPLVLEAKAVSGH